VGILLSRLDEDEAADPWSRIWLELATSLFSAHHSLGAIRGGPHVDESRRTMAMYLSMQSTPGTTPVTTSLPRSGLPRAARSSKT
jgi:hypothetical protein